MTQAQLERALLTTQLELATVKATLGTLIAWIGGSAASPLSAREVSILLGMLPQEK